MQFRSQSFFAFVALATGPALALVYPGPRATDTATDCPDATGWTPRPTTAPDLLRSIGDLRPKHIRRQVLGPDTCGWVNGEASIPVTCDPGNACALDTTVSYFGCCSTDSNGDFISSDYSYIATPYTSCWNYASAAGCTGACYTENRVCDASAPYCVTGLLFLNNYAYQVLTHYGCASDSSVTDLEIETTTSGAAPTTVPPITSPISTKPNVITTTVPPSSHSSSPPTPNPNPIKHSSHAGAIAGGVVGGLAFLAIVLVGGIVLLRKKKKDQRKSIMPEVSQM